MEAGWHKVGELGVFMRCWALLEIILHFTGRPAGSSAQLEGSRVSQAHL